MKGARRWAVAVFLAAVSFGGAFAVTRAVEGGDDPPPVAAPRVETPAEEASLDNLERPLTIKPLRSVAGGPPPAASPSPPTQSGQP